ncbi:MAG: DMT family transporter [Roseobacter sp.]
MIQKNNVRLGVTLMLLASLVFAFQDGISRHLATEYNVYMVVMIRYWFFAVFVIIMAQRGPDGIRAAVRTKQPFLQAFRGLVLSLQVCVMIAGFTLLGLVESHAVFACYPLIVAALSGPILGERVGWRRWTAITIGFVGVLIILQPGYGVFDLASLVPLAAATMFALYAMMTRYAGRLDPSAVSFFWTGVVGACVSSLIGIWFWETMTVGDWGWMGLLCMTSVLGHWLLIRCYDAAEVSAVQPFAYAHLVFAAALGLLFFGEALRSNVALGVLVIVAAGLFTLWRERLQT